MFVDSRDESMFDRMLDKAKEGLIVNKNHSMDLNQEGQIHDLLASALTRYLTNKKTSLDHLSKNIVCAFSLLSKDPKSELNLSDYDHVSEDKPKLHEYTSPSKQQFTGTKHPKHHLVLDQSLDDGLQRSTEKTKKTRVS